MRKALVVLAALVGLSVTLLPPTTAGAAKPNKPTTTTTSSTTTTTTSTSTTTTTTTSTTTTTVPSAPTAAELEQNGPYAFASVAVTDAQTPGFGAATIYYPTTTGTFGGIAISPGFTGTQSSVSWYGPRLASHGFVVITINTNSPYDQPPARATQLLAALDYLTGASAARDKVDAGRLAVMGHSMGGGGAIEATNTRRSIKASIPLTPWDTTKEWPGVQTPTLVIGAESDTVAPVATHAIPLYEGLTGAAEKAYLELDNASHDAPTGSNARISRFSIAWLKRFVDGNTAYDVFLCPPPVAGSGGISQYRSTCPH